MSMKLGSASLADLSTAVEKIEKSGIEVESFRFGDHRVMLTWSEGRAFVVGVTNGGWGKGSGSLGGGATRGSSIPGGTAPY